jgi:23S rRNA (cytosine1962-C5)-methyltransferase
MISVLLNKGKEKAVLHQHPWVFSGALQALKEKPKNGDLVKVLSQKQEFLAYGYFNDASRVAVRLLSFKNLKFLMKIGGVKKLKKQLKQEKKF